MPPELARWKRAATLWRQPSWLTVTAASSRAFPLEIDHQQLEPHCGSCRLKQLMRAKLKTLENIAAAEIEATLAALPAPLQEQARKLPVTLEPQPSRALQADGIEPDTLGLFTGPEFADEQHSTLPPQIILFLENIWDEAEGNEEVFREEVRKTFLHELGHYLGLDEDELTERGLE